MNTRKNKMKNTIVFLLLLPLVLIAQNKDSVKVAKIFGRDIGTFVLFDQQKEKYFFYNQQRAQERFLPASTFKILNSLVALELKIIPDENFVIKWDGIKRENENWNKDHSLRSAIKFSVVPFYQELARKIERDNYKKYLEAIGYGNCVIGNDIDRFWLDNSLKISAEEQISFLKRFYNYKLPFKKEVVDIVKKILPKENYKNSVLSFKTGTGKLENGKWLGWIVGYVEKSSNVSFFAFNIEANSFEDVVKLRDKKSREILKKLNLITQSKKV